MIEVIQNADWAILHWIGENLHFGFLDFLIPKITFLGSGGIIWIIAAIILLCRQKYRKYGIFLGAALIACLLVGNFTLKPLVARDRPCWIDQNVELLVRVPHDYSFPSGHAMSSVAAATVLTFANKKFAFAAIPLAVLISFSRLYLYVHFPSDVLAGTAIGFLLGWLAVFFGRKIASKTGRKRQSNKEKHIEERQKQ